MSRPKGSEPKARARILGVSRRLFARRGFAETSMGDIARAAGVARATVYNHFGDKQEILAAIIGEYLAGHAGLAQQLRENARCEQTSFDLIHETVREALAWRLKNADLLPVLAVARNLRGSGWEAAKQAADEAMLGWILSVHAADEAAGLVREDIDLEFAVRAAYAMVESALSGLDAGAGPEEIAPAARQLALLHWYSICSVPPEGAPRSPLGR